MPTVGRILGQSMRVLIGESVIECEDGFTLSVDGEEIDVSCKSSGNWGDTLAGTKTWNVSVNAKLEVDATTNGFFDILDNFVDGTELDIEITTHDGTAGIVGDKFISGTVVVGSTSLSGNRNEAVTWEATLLGRGPLVTSTRAA